MERISILHWLKNLWQGGRKGATEPSAEVERIAALQQAAVRCRAEYAAAQERARESAAESDALAPLREQVQKAELAHAVALQAWDNKQFRR